ncbi:hypothetical protein EDD21DRAFT_421404 [Dissophora ornata]|nr:hypothetical protein EDD21DRAFT_421404 [Dissophora ornata]
MANNYMDQIWPIRVTDDDNSTIYNGPLHGVCSHIYVGLLLLPEAIRMCGEKFEDIYNWVSGRDSKTVDRWRQQLCEMALQGANIAARKKRTVNSAVYALSEMVSRFCTNVDPNPVARLLRSPLPCSYSSILFPQSRPLLARHSNPAEAVTLVIFHAFEDNSSTFNMEAKVWCH